LGNEFIGVITNEASDGVCDDVEGFHGAAEVHFFLKNFGKEGVNEDNLKKISKSDFRKGHDEKKTKRSKNA